MGGGEQREGKRHNLKQAPHLAESPMVGLDLTSL